MTSQAGKLCKKYPDHGEATQKKLGEAQDNWERLEDLAQARRLKLQDSHKLHDFLVKAKEHVSGFSLFAIMSVLIGYRSIAQIEMLL